VHVPQYQKVEAASKDSRTIIIRPYSRFQDTAPLKMGGKDLEMVDVDAQHATEPSLQRLKTLDSLPDLKSQLKTANEYCNHGHRAEMIIKWLTAKMQSDAKAASNAEAWNLLEHCFRLVAPQKMGILLARFHLLNTARTSMQNLEGKKLAKLLDAITKAIETLEEISSGSDGAVVKQLLSTDGASAAALLGVWTNRVSALISGADASETTSHDNVRFVLPAVRLWAARKPSASDNDAFAKNCLVPCSLLLQQLNGSTSSGSNKRRRGSKKGAATDADVAHDVEILIARHVFLPARSAFFQSVEKEVAEETVSEIAGKLSSVKSAISAAGGPQEQLCESLPKLLDVALRCVPMTTSRQRSKERPWVEHIFQELLACLDMDGKLVSQKALSGMLQIVGTRASLPGTILKDLVQRYSGLGQSKKASSIDFAMIAEVVALDATVFVDSVMADQLFPALTQTSRKGLDSNTDDKVLLAESITKPVMRAFATSRKLENFVLRWQQQLQTVEDPKTWTVWIQLDDLLAELLEVHLTIEQIEQLFDTLRSAIQVSSEKSSKDDSTPESQRAGAVVLHALLKGAKSDELIQKLQARVGHLFDTVLVLVEGTKVKAIPTEIWNLLSLTFKLWFPTWAAKQTQRDLVSKNAQSLLSNKAVERIMKASASGKGVDLAETFVGLLCTYLQSYEACQDLASSIAVRLAKATTETISPVFLAFPDQLLNLGKEDRHDMIEKFVTSAIGSSSTQNESTPQNQALAAFVNTAAASSNTKLADEVIAAVLKATGSDEDIVLDLLLQTPASTLARGQRERILNWATGLDYSSGTEARLTKRYAVMVRLMQLPNASANLCTDASVIWNLCRGPSASKKSRSGKEKKPAAGRATSKVNMLAMLEELTHLLCTYLLATQDQERSRTVLQALVKRVVKEMESTVDMSTASYGRLVMIKAIVQLTDTGVGKSVFSHLAGDVAAPLKTFSERLLKDTQSSVKALKKQEDMEQTIVSSKVLFELLVCFRKSGFLGENLATEDKALVKLCNKILAKPSADDDADSTSAGTNYLLVPAFRLLAHISGFEACTSLGEALLGSSISPKDRQLLIEELKRIAKESQTSEQLSVLKKVIPSAQDASTQSIVILQNALAAVSRDSIAKDEQGIHALYLKLLETLRQTKDFATYTAATACLLTIIRDKPFILNQHLTEATLQAIQTLARSSPAERLIYLDLCSILSALLLHHRARLQGRFHLLTATLQSLQTRLFVPTKPTADSNRRILAPRHARAYTRLLTLLCNPPTRTHNNSSAGASKHNNLIDESRRARAHVGQYVPTLLHSFCAQILSGTLGEGVREALTPGLWAVIEAMEVQSPDAIKALSAGMNNSERAVLRSVYEDWKRFGKWEGA
jgi:nucleolar pre-ribosomal-associated protein 2